MREPIKDYEGLRIVSMGHGDVLILGGSLEGMGGRVGTLSFCDGHGTHPINVPDSAPKGCIGRPDTEASAKVRLEFDALASVDAVIAELQIVRSKMVAAGAE